MKIDESISFLEGTTKTFIIKKIQYLISRIPDLEYIILFGSYARTEQTIKSEIDLMAITSSIPDRLLRGDLCSEFDEENIDLVFYDIETFRNSRCLLVSQVKKKRIVLWKNPPLLEKKHIKMQQKRDKSKSWTLLICNYRYKTSQPRHTYPWLCSCF
ncbi:nucleotidyltransferase domain-containing protein [Muricomes sp. OA1]|uniref:Nucleotidyltransferase domain-containing protein n=1 Tax=Hungatella hathewayi TaxID=154046 RepID=A0A3E2WZL0_9FIRM|nr:MULTISPECIES: nucleotidyltransferase domain-containing protein [Clostridia]MCH1975039.1 nucleotidyltransferase domain-containing protein [Muricomes sp. OA1]RGC33988.1 nucleotidyltransferase domain-containing protein [Hungatella hathewayi]